MMLSLCGQKRVSGGEKNIERKKKKGSANVFREESC